MIQYSNKNIFADPSDALVDPCNCIGVAGGGLSAVFRALYPDVHQNYKKACKSGELKIGTILVYKTAFHSSQPNKYIINLPTKDDLSPSRLSYVRKGLKALVEYLKSDDKIKSVALPALGCGLGGLSWGTVKEVMEEELAALPHIQFTIYNPK